MKRTPKSNQLDQDTNRVQSKTDILSSNNNRWSTNPTRIPNMKRTWKQSNIPNDIKNATPLGRPQQTKQEGEGPTRRVITINDSTRDGNEEPMQNQNNRIPPPTYSRKIPPASATSGQTYDDKSQQPHQHEVYHNDPRPALSHHGQDPHQHDP